MRLKQAAGWNQTEADWHNMMTLEPDGCFGIDCDGALRATTTAVCYGQELAWVGMVLTDSAYRRRGLALRLMEHALDYIRSRSVVWIKLDATEMGAPLYERLGFREEGTIERWTRPRGAVPGGHSQAGRFELDAVLDQKAFGADRSHVLQMLAGIESVSAPGGAYAMGRPGSAAAYFGPCVAHSAAAARDLVRWFLGRHSNENVCWDILRANTTAGGVAREFGFERARELSRMALPGAPGELSFKKNDQLVFATAGFEFG
jgi:GNAT superfamily N-acetyltransferase